MLLLQIFQMYVCFFLINQMPMILLNGDTWMFLKKDLDRFKEMVSTMDLTIYDIIKGRVLLTKLISLNQEFKKAGA